MKEIRAMLGWAHVTAFTYAIPLMEKTREEKKGFIQWHIVKGFENWYSDFLTHWKRLKKKKTSLVRDQ